MLVEARLQIPALARAVPAVSALNNQRGTCAHDPSHPAPPLCFPPFLTARRRAWTRRATPSCTIWRAPSTSPSSPASRCAHELLSCCSLAAGWWRGWGPPAFRHVSRASGAAGCKWKAAWHQQQARLDSALNTLLATPCILAHPPPSPPPQGGPHNHTISGLACALKQAATPEFKSYQEQVGYSWLAWLGLLSLEAMFSCVLKLHAVCHPPTSCMAVQIAGAGHGPSCP